MDLIQAETFVSSQWSVYEVHYLALTFNTFISSHKF